MNERRELIRLPQIYNCGGRLLLKDKWFIEFYVRNPRTDKMDRFRKAKGINKFHTLKERNAAAEEMKRYWTEKLKSGWTPFLDTNIIYEDNLEYQTYIKNYRALKSKNGTFRYYASKHLDAIKNNVEPKTISTYRSKLRLFDAWLQREGLNDADVSVIDQTTMIRFMVFIIEKRQLSKVSVDNYRILLDAVFKRIKKERKQYPNPVFDLPETKRVNDSAAQPIHEMDIEPFKKRISKEDPQLWLAICFEYYCFLRPRKEIRFLKIGHIDFGRATIRVTAENSKTTARIVTIPRVFLEILRNTYKLHTYNRDFFVFSKKGLPGDTALSYNNMSERFARIRDTMQMPAEYKMYSWKHTGNICADNAGIPRREIQDQNGHTTIQTTEIYMKNRHGRRSENIIEKFPRLGSTGQF